MKDFIKTRYIPKWQKFPWTFKTWLEKNWWALIIALQIIIIGLILFDHRTPAKVEIAAPIPEEQIIKPSPTSLPYCNPNQTAILYDDNKWGNCTEKPSPSPEAKIEKPQTKNWVGIASYYSRSGCVGCSKTLTMANGKPLDDTKLTVAFNWLPLGSFVKITNKITGTFVNAEVTDTGGFNRLGRIIDLGLATKEAIRCSSLCQVRVEKI